MGDATWSAIFKYRIDLFKRNIKYESKNTNYVYNCQHNSSESLL
jgi:hypothetical protein